jgi:three-Cys-motif partner protein
VPTIDGVGQGRFTEIKQELFRKICNYNLIVAKATANKSQEWASPILQYIDATAGHGKEDTYGNGSPLIFLEIAKELELNYAAIFIEKDLGVFMQLVNNVPSDKRHTLYIGSYQKILPSLALPKKRFGMLYIDPNGTGVTDFDTSAVRQFAEKYPFIDILLRISANNMKRNFHGDRRISDIASEIGKATWLMTDPEPNDKDQWIFLLGTGPRSPIGAYKKIGLNPIHEISAQQAMLICSFTREERAIIQSMEDINPIFNIRVKASHKSILSVFTETRKKLLEI